MSDRVVLLVLFVVLLLTTWTSSLKSSHDLNINRFNRLMPSIGADAPGRTRTGGRVSTTRIASTERDIAIEAAKQAREYLKDGQSLGQLLPRANLEAILNQSRGNERNKAEFERCGTVQ
jgi:hypothetical protein